MSDATLPVIVTLCTLLAGAAIALSVATEPGNDVNVVTSFDVAWSSLPDGSFYATKDAENHENAAAYRCWSTTAGKYECLAAGKGPLGSISVARTSFDELPHLLIPIVSDDDGYSCGATMGSYEQISARDGVLTTNREGPPWSKTFVRRYMADNTVKGTGWFPCLKVLDAIQAGSLATLRSTTIKRSMLGA